VTVGTPAPPAQVDDVRGYQDIRLAVSDQIAVLTLHRPHALNAITDRMEVELLDALDRCDADDDVRVVVVTGAGRAFCAGMDLSASSGTFESWRRAAAGPDADPDVLPVRRDGGGRVVLRLFGLHKPVIAAINGHAVGGGITITLAADIRIAADGARMSFPFTRRGLVAESCSSWFLPRVVPVQRAMEWMLTGRTFPAQEALDAGLVLSLHPADEVLPVALALAREIVENTSAVSVALTRRLLWSGLGAEHPMTAHELETLALNLRGLSADARDGIAAFLEKRAPRFPDRVSTDLPDVLDRLPDPPYRPVPAPTDGPA
jgi:enoyl-CoA hydratase/carnithine racemase